MNEFQQALNPHPKSRTPEGVTLCFRVSDEFAQLIYDRRHALGFKSDSHFFRYACLKAVNEEHESSGWCVG
jgi:hypothetical protein